MFTSRLKYFAICLCVAILAGQFSRTASALTVGPVSVTTPADPSQVSLYGKIEFSIPLSTSSTKFFEADPTQGGVDLSAVFTAPDTSTVTIKGFYNGSVWLIRFAPTRTGVWQAAITATDSSGSASVSTVSFTCVASSNSGFAQINGKYIQFSNGTAFFAVGHNNGWQYNVEQPLLSDMAAQGENLLSFWFAAPWAKPTDGLPVSARTPIENVVGGLGNYDQIACTYIDSVVANAEAAGIYLLPSIWAHDQLCDGSAPSGWPTSWSNNAYSTICSATNFYQTTSGSADSAQWRLQKNYYRYVLARWGYSRAIAGWVGVVEIDGTTGYALNSTQATNWCAALRTYFAANDKFRTNTSGTYPLIVSRVDVPTFDGGMNMRGTDSYTSKTSNVAVAATLASETATMLLSGKPSVFPEFGGDTLSGASQPAHLHNGIWAGTATGTAMTPLLWCDGGNYPMLTNASNGAAMRTQLQNLAQFVAGLDYIGSNSSIPGVPGMSSPSFKAWSLQLNNRGFAWIQNTTGGTMGGQTLTVHGLAAGQYSVAWFNVWSSGDTPFATTPTVTVNGSGNLAVAVPALAQPDIACRFFLNAGPPSTPGVSANPNPVTGTSTTLSAVAADDGGEANLTYTWSAIGNVPAPVTFGANGTNAAKNCVATFSDTGTYTFQVVVKDLGGLTASGTVLVAVNVTLSPVLTVTPQNTILGIYGTQQFMATMPDQFGHTVPVQPIWSVDGGGTIDSTGLFVAGGAGGGPFTVMAITSQPPASATVSLTITAGTPTATAQSVNVPFNTGKSITLAGTDPNVPALALTYTVTASPSHGALSGTSPNLIYTPTIGFSGADSFQFTVKNTANLTSAVATVSLTIAAGTPTAIAQSVTVPFNTGTSITLAGTDPNVPALTLIYTVTASPTHGTLSGTAPNLTYMPTTGFNGADSFQFTVKNTANLTSAAATVSLTVATGTPTATAQSVNIPFSAGTSITLAGTDPNIPALPLTYTVTASPAHGTLSGTAPNMTYMPTTGYNGADSFQFTVKNTANLTSAAATVSLTVATGTPTATAQSVNVPFSAGTSITLAGTDPNIPALALTYTVTASPTHGALCGTAPNLTYTPTSGYNGTDTFQFTVKNTANLTSGAATVSLTIAAGTPTANAQSANVAHDTATALTLAASDVDNPALTQTFNTPSTPAHGVLSGFNSSTGTLTYTPNANYQGSDSFTFTVTNGTNTSTPGTVSLTIAPGTPTANMQSANVAHDTAKALTLTGSDPDVPALPLTFAIGTASHGTLTGFNVNTRAVTYTPNSNYQGLDSFTFTVKNGTNTSAPATVTLAVAPGTPIAAGYAVDVEHDTPTTMTLGAFEFDIPELPLTFSYQQPSHGTVTGTGSDITYTPTANYQGYDSFTFTASNGTNTSDPGTITLIVFAGTPTANAQVVNAAFSTGTPITLTGTDLDVPVLALTYKVTAGPAHGTLSGLNASTGAVTYIPTTGYNGADSFQFTVKNTFNCTSTAATVSLIVAPGRPTANAQSANVAHDIPKALTLTGIDPDLPVLPLTYNYQQPSHGVVTGTAPNITYTPSGNYQGTDSFSFAVNNGTNTSSAATVSLTVAAGTPTAIAQSANAAFNAATPITLAGSDPNVPVLALTYTVTAGPAHGTLTGSAPNLIYTPTNFFSGAESFQFAVMNSANLTSTAATVSLTVAANPPPVFTSSPAAVPNPAIVGHAVQFSTNATNALTVNYAWDFGDGTTASGASVSHVFLLEGNYSISVTATDAVNGATSASIVVQVNAAVGMAGGGGTLLPGETDSDGDGFSDAVEIVAGSNPNDATITPVMLGNSSTLQTPQLIINAVLKVTPAKHTLKLTGSITIPKGFVPLNKLFVADIGGFIQKFTLTKNGSAKTGKDLFHVHLKFQKGAVIDQTSKFSLTLNNVPASIVPTSEILLLLDGMVFTRH